MGPVQNLGDSTAARVPSLSPVLAAALATLVRQLLSFSCPAGLARTAWHSGREPQPGVVQLRVSDPLRTLGVQRVLASFENECSLEMSVHLR